jgi:hypothetical protein
MRRPPTAAFLRTGTGNGGMKRAGVVGRGVLMIGAAVISAATAAFQTYEATWGVKEWVLVCLGLVGTGLSATRAFIDQSVTREQEAKVRVDVAPDGEEGSAGAT